MDPHDRIAHETALRAAVLRGDPTAFDALCRPLLRSVYGFALARSAGDRTQAEEIVQEAWLIAVRKIRRFDPRLGSFESWVKGITHQVLRNARRAHERGPTITSRETESLEDTGVREPSLVEPMVLALTELPELYQQVLRARYHQDRTVVEIAHSLGRSPKAVESLLARARDALRRALTQYEPDLLPRRKRS